jgi:imidazolonepropionase-like amidohydrolase
MSKHAYLRAYLFLLGLLFLSLSALAQDASSTKKSTIVRAGRLLDVRAGIYRDDQGVLIEGERIREVGPFKDIQARAPGDAAVLDLQKMTVLPGLIDCHSHLLDAMEGRWRAGEAIILTITQLGLARRALLGAAMARETLEAGITTVRNVGHSGINGDAALRDAINAGWVVGPRILAATRKLTPPGGQAVAIQSEGADSIIAQEFLPLSGPEEARRAVREALAAGADVIKVVADDGKRILNAVELSAIAEEAHRVKIKVAVHATSNAGIKAAIEAGVDSIEHGDEATDEDFRAMHDKGISLVPTLNTADTYRDLYQKEFASTPEERVEFERIVKGIIDGGAKKVQRATKAGVKVAAGSDMWMRYPGKTRGAATIRMFEALRNTGMTTIEVLRTGTINAAELLGWEDRVGSIEAGKFADLIAIEGDPLSDIGELRRVNFVMKGGVVVKKY